MSDATELSELLKAEALRLGCEAVGICPASTPRTDLEMLRGWIATGCAAGMDYIESRSEAYENPDRVLLDVKSVIMVAVPYATVGIQDDRALSPSQGCVARYARGESDYHHVLRGRLKELGRFLRGYLPEAHTRAVVDTAPLLERAYACQAGLGGFGKNTTLVHPKLGSRFFLGGLLTDAVLDYDKPAKREAPCGECRRCLDACPTGALCSPYTLDSRLCLNYWMIESPELPPQELRRKYGNRVFGCDVCQDVCPLNAGEPTSDADPAFAASEKIHPMDLSELFHMDERAFKERFGRTPIARAGRAGLLRNAAIVLGTQDVPEAVDTLIAGLSDEDVTVRAACARALDQYDDDRAREALKQD